MYSQRDLLIVLHCGSDLELLVSSLNDILDTAEAADNFIRTHELITRFGITKSKRKLKKYQHAKSSKPFQYLITLN